MLWEKITDGNLTEFSKLITQSRNSIFYLIMHSTLSSNWLYIFEGFSLFLLSINWSTTTKSRRLFLCAKFSRSSRSWKRKDYLERREEGHHMVAHRTEMCLWQKLVRMSAMAVSCNNNSWPFTALLAAALSTAIKDQSFLLQYLSLLFKEPRLLLDLHSVL